MDATGVEILLCLFCVLGLVIWWYVRQYQFVETARRTWPTIDAMIQSGAVEPVENCKFRLPVFAFSYQVAGNYYSGRFCLSFLLDRPETMIERLVGQKLKIHYNPTDPAKYLVHEDTIDGCPVGQKLGPHFVRPYPPN
jgi:Protein of unknown function (DUF3592)